MKTRIPLIVAVVGALLIGGAATGTTRASWTGQAQMQPHSVTAGRMSYTATTPAGVTVEKVAGSTADTTFVLDDTSLGKNLAQRITASVGTTPTGVTATIGTSCPGAASASVDTTPTSADQTLCVRVTSSTTAVSGDVVINLSSAQRPVAGWTTSTITRVVAVTVSNPVVAPAAPQLSCGTRTDNDIPFSWTAVSGETYTVYRSTTSNTASAFGTAPTPPAHATPYTVAMPSNNTTVWFRVTATNSAGTSAFSNTVEMKRVNGAASIVCTRVVTP